MITDVDYTEEEQSVWRFVAGELEELHREKASPFYLKAKKSLGISNDRIPQFSEMTKRLKETTGFRLAPIEGLVDTRAFLSWLSWRTMLSTQYIRHHSRPGYTPEPDIVHEAMGHIPMFTNRILRIFRSLSVTAHASPRTNNSKVWAEFTGLRSSSVWSKPTAR